MTEKALANQGALNSLTSKFGGRTPVRIFFLDNSSKIFLAESSMVTKDTIKMILEKFGVIDSDNVVTYYGVFVSRNGAAIDGALNMEEPIVKVIQEWPEESGSKLIFMTRLLMPCLWGIQHKDIVARKLKVQKSSLDLDTYIQNAEEIDQSLTHIQYLQAVYSIITGQYPVTEEKALELGSLHFLFKFGDYQSSRHQVGFLGQRIVEFIPVKLLKLKTTEEWEGVLLNAVKEYSSKYPFNISCENSDEDRPQRRYMKLIFAMTNYFGYTFFRTSQKSTQLFPEKVIVGISNQGVGIFDRHREILQSYRLEEIYRWGYKPNQLFYFEVKQKEGTELSVEFDTVEGQLVSDLLTDYAMAYMKEKEMEALRASEVDRKGRDSVEDKSAIKVQSVFRGHVARKNVSILIEDMLEKGELPLDEE